MLAQIIGMVRNVTGLPSPVLGPGILGRVGDGNYALPLIVDDFAHIHVQLSLVIQKNVRCTVSHQYPAVCTATTLVAVDDLAMHDDRSHRVFKNAVSAGNPARQIDLAPRRFDIFHHQMVRGRIPIDLRLIVKGIIIAVPFDSAVINLVHGAVLHDDRTVCGTLLRRGQLLLLYRGGVCPVATLNQAVHIDIGGGHIDIAASDITCRHSAAVTTIFFQFLCIALTRLVKAILLQVFL